MGNLMLQSKKIVQANHGLMAVGPKIDLVQCVHIHISCTCGALRLQLDVCIDVDRHMLGTESTNGAEGVLV